MNVRDIFHRQNNPFLVLNILIDVKSLQVQLDGCIVQSFILFKFSQRYWCFGFVFFTSDFFWRHSVNMREGYFAAAKKIFLSFVTIQLPSANASLPVFGHVWIASWQFNCWFGEVSSVCEHLLTTDGVHHFAEWKYHYGAFLKPLFCFKCLFFNILVCLV